MHIDKTRVPKRRFWRYAGAMLSLMKELGMWAARAVRTEADMDVDVVKHAMSVQFASRPEFGDLQIASCLQLAKPLKRSPRDLAQLVVRSLAAHPAVEKTEIAGPGYVNIFLRDTWLAQQVTQLRGDGARGVRAATKQATAVVDFSSPNVAKPMHVGHIRSTIVGDAICHVLKAVGYRVIADNHLGDWGTQFGKLIVAYRRWLDAEALARSPLDELVRLYQKFVAEEKEQAGVQEIVPVQADSDVEEEQEQDGATPLLREARAELVRLQQGDPENLALWKEFVRISLQDFQRHYDRLGIHFDTFHGESFYHDALAPLVARLLAQGVAVHSEGAVVCPVEGEPVPLLIQKADGAYLYGTTDLATIAYREEQYQPQRVLYVVGAPQQMHFRQVFAVARRMGVVCALEHISFGSIRFFDPGTQKWIMGGTRKGNAPLLDALLDEAIQRAEQASRQRNPEYSDDKHRAIAKQVGLGAVKYNFLNRDRNLDIHFDVEQALSLEGNTAPYVQYAYARVRSIQRKAEWNGSASDAYQLYSPAERVLARKLLSFSWVLDQVAASIRLHALAEYLYDLAVATNQFYHEVHVTKSPPAEKAARLQLLDEVAATLRYGLSLLGIECPEEM